MSLSNNVMFYGLFPPREGKKLPQFPTPGWPKDSPFPILKKETKMNEVQKFIKILRNKVSERSGYIDKKEMDTIILDTLEEMGNNE